LLQSQGHPERPESLESTPLAPPEKLEAFCWKVAGRGGAVPPAVSLDMASSSPEGPGNDRHSLTK